MLDVGFSKDRRQRGKKIRHSKRTALGMGGVPWKAYWEDGLVNRVMGISLS